MNKASRVSLAVGSVAVVGAAALILGNYLVPGGLFQSSLITPQTQGVLIGDGFTSATGSNFLINQDFLKDDGFLQSPTLSTQIDPMYLGGNVRDTNANDLTPDGWLGNFVSYYNVGIPLTDYRTPKVIMDKTSTNPSEPRLLMDARDKGVEASIRQINYLPPDKLKLGDKFVLRAWVTSANNNDIDSQVKVGLVHNDCTNCGGNSEVSYSSADYVSVKTGAYQMVTTPIMTITKDEVMRWNSTAQAMEIIPGKLPAGSAIEGNLTAQIMVKPGHAAYVKSAELLKVSEDGSILSNGTFPVSGAVGYVRTAQPALPQGTTPTLPGGWGSIPFANGMLSCSNPATVLNVGQAVRVVTGDLDGCIYQYKVQGDWNPALKKYVSDVKVGNEYVVKATVQGGTNDAYIGVSATHLTEPDIATMKNYDFDHVKVWGTASKDAPTTITTTPLKITNEDATGLHILGANVTVYGPNASATIKSVEMIQCTRDANGNYVQNDCNSANRNSSTLVNADMKLDQGIGFSNATYPNTVAADSKPDQWGFSCNKNDGSAASTTNVMKITTDGAEINMPDDVAYCDTYQVLDVPFVKGDSYVAVAKLKGDEKTIKYAETYSQIVHNTPWSGTGTYPATNVKSNPNTLRSLGNGVWEAITPRLVITDPNHVPGQADYWNFRREYIFRITRSTPFGQTQPPVTIMRADVIPCASIDQTSDTFKNYCEQDLFPKGNRVSANPNLEENTGIVFTPTSGGLIKPETNDGIPDGWAMGGTPEDIRANTTYVMLSNQLRAFFIKNNITNVDKLLTLVKYAKAPAANGKKYIAAVRMQSATKEPADVRLQLIHNPEKDVSIMTTVDSGILKVQPGFSTITNDNSLLKTYYSPLLNVTKESSPLNNLGDLKLRILPQQFSAINIQSAAIYEVSDADLETINEKLQLKPTSNGSFEKDNGTDFGLPGTDTAASNNVPDGWYKSGCGADSGIVTDNKAEGTSSFRMTQSGTGLCMLQQHSAAPIKQGDLYVLSAKVKNPGNTDGVFQMRWVHNFGNAELTETNPEEGYTGEVIPKNSDWKLVRYKSKMKIASTDAPYDRTSTTEIFNISNTSGIFPSTGGDVPLLVDDVKFTNCTANPAAPECIETPDTSLSPDNQQLLYNPDITYDGGRLPLTDADKKVINNNMTAKDGIPDGWFIDGWAGPNSAVKVGFEDVKDINFGTGDTYTTKYFKIDTTAVPTSQTPLTSFIQTRSIPTQKGDKFRAVAMVRTANDSNAPVKISMNLEHNPYAASRPKEDYANGEAMVGNTQTRIETGILTITNDDLVAGQNNWDRGNLGVALYVERGVKVYVDKVYLYRVPNDFNDLVPNKTLTTDNASLYTFGEYTANKTAEDKMPDGWRSLCTDVAQSKDYTNYAQFASTSQAYYFNEQVYLAAFPDVAAQIGAGKQYATALDHFNAIGKKAGYLNKAEYAAAIQQLAPGYREDAYMIAFPDVALVTGPGRSFVSSLDHYLSYGKNESRLTRAEYTTAVANLGASTQTLFKHDAGYSACEVAQVNNTSTTIGDKYVAYAKIKNVSLKQGVVTLSIAHNWWADVTGAKREPSVFASNQTLDPGVETTLKTGLLTIADPDASGHNSYIDLYKLGATVYSTTPNTAYRISEVNIVNCTKDPKNDMCLPTPDTNLLGKGNQLLVNSEFTADNGAVPKENIGLKMDGLPNNGIPDGWNDDGKIGTMMTFGRSNAVPVVKLIGGTGQGDFRQIIQRTTKNKKYQAVVTVRTANPGNTPAKFTVQIAHNPYASAEMKTNIFTAEGEAFTTYSTDILSVTQDAQPTSATGGFNNLLFNIFPTAGHDIYVQKAELFEIADTETILAQNGSFEDDNGSYYSQVIGGNTIANDKLPDGWTFVQNIPLTTTLDTTRAKTGATSLKISTSTAPTYATLYQSHKNKTKIGDSYVLAADVFATVPTQIGLMLTHNGAGDKSIQSAPGTIQVTASGSTWTRVVTQKMKIAFLDVAGTETLRSTIEVMSPNKTVFVDNVQLINCTENPSAPECTTDAVQNPVLTNGAFELDDGTTDLQDWADTIGGNNVPDTWRRNCAGSATIGITDGKTEKGAFLQSTTGGECIYQYSNFNPIIDHIYVASADIKSATTNQYTTNLLLINNPNTSSAEIVSTLNGVGDSWKTVVTPPLKIKQGVLLPKDMPYNALDRFGIILSLQEANAKVLMDNITITDCTLYPTAAPCTLAVANVSAEKSQTMGNGIVVKGQSQQKLGSVKLSGIVNPTSLQSLKLTFADTTTGLSNFKLSSTGTTLLSGQSGSGTVLYTFGTGTAGVTLAKDESRVFDIYADVAANATASGSLIQLSVADKGVGYIDTIFNKALVSSAGPVVLQQMQLNAIQPAIVGTLKAAKNAAFIDQQFSKNGSSQKVGSFTLAATGENYKVESIFLNLSGTNGVSNLYMTSSGQLLGSTVVSPTLTNLFGFANTPLYVAKDKSVVVDIYATIGATSTITTLQTSIDANAVVAKNDVNATITTPGSTMILQALTASGSVFPSAPSTPTPTVSTPTTATSSAPTYLGAGGGSAGGSSLGQLPAGTGSGGGKTDLVCPPSCEAAIVPKDVSTTHFAYNAVKYLSARGILKGYSDNTFRLQSAINRAEFVKIISNGFQLTTIEKTAVLPLKDVKPTDWFYGALRTVYKAGLVKGYATGNFLPSKNIQRDEAVKIMALADAATAIKSKNKNLTDAEATVQAETLITTQWSTWRAAHPKYTYVQFTDASVNAWYAKYLLYVVEKGYVSGRTINGVKIFAPADQITRGEASVLIARIIDANKMTYPAVKKADNTYSVAFPE